MNLLKYLLPLITLLPLSIMAQGNAWGIKGGMSMTTQTWNGFQKDPLFNWHADIYYENVPDVKKAAFFIEGGYHVRGFVFRNPSFQTNQGNLIYAKTFRNKCHNISVMLGGKKYISNSGNSKFYYGLGVRGEFTVASDFEIYEGYEDYVRKINAGVTLSGGWQFPVTEFFQGVFEMRVSPDFTKQIFAPPGYFPNTYTGVNEPYPEQNVRNVSFEVALGFRIFTPYDDEEVEY
ncbi:MAG: hypothetical protein ABIV51_07270 [Saprospiraceae bacterium]